MGITNAFLYIFTGLLAGSLSGLIGIGGGVIIIPILVIFAGLSQKMAQGTTLALLVPPIGILAAWTYYKQGYVDFPIAGLICVGFIFGGLIGAKFATHLSNQTLEKNIRDSITDHRNKNDFREVKIDKINYEIFNKCLATNNYRPKSAPPFSVLVHFNCAITA